MVRLGRVRYRRTPHVLVVCTGNVCRSPLIAALLADAAPALTVRSAGTAALAGAPATDQVLDVLHAVGLPGQDHIGRQLTRSMVRSAGLIITAARAHRLAVTELSADAAERTFTLKEFARLLPDAAADGADFDTVLARIADVSHAETLDHDDDLADPYGLGSAAYSRMFREVYRALTVIGPSLAGP